MSYKKMTVKDLREFLEKQDPNLPVLVPSFDHSYVFASAATADVYLDDDKFFWECDLNGDSNRKAIVIGH